QASAASSQIRTCSETATPCEALRSCFFYAAAFFFFKQKTAYEILVDGKLVKSIGPEKLMKDTESWRSRENYEAAFSQVTAPRLRGALAEIEDPLRSFLSSWKGTDFPRRQEVEVTLGEILSGNR